MEVDENKRVVVDVYADGVCVDHICVDQELWERAELKCGDMSKLIMDLIKEDLGLK